MIDKLQVNSENEIKKIKDEIEIKKKKIKEWCEDIYFVDLKSKSKKSKDSEDGDGDEPDII